MQLLCVHTCSYVHVACIQVHDAKHLAVWGLPTGRRERVDKLVKFCKEVEEVSCRVDSV